MDSLLRDVRLACRSLLATPTFTIVAMLSMALGIGANTAIFSILNSLLLRPLPVADPTRLVKLTTATSRDNFSVYSFALFDQIRQQTNAFQGALAYGCCGKGLLSSGAAQEPVDQILTSGDFFTTLGLRPYLGRLFTLDDDRPGGGSTGPNAVISYALWRRLGGHADLIGQSVTIDRVPVTVIGVAPPSFFGLEVGRRFDVALPIHAQSVLDPANALSDDLDYLQIWLRLRSDTLLATSTAALRAAQPQIRTAAMPNPPPSAEWMTDPFSLQPAAFGTSALRDRFDRPLLALLVLVALVLLVACANLANLLTARGIARRHEMSVRVALGAARVALVRQLLAESLVLAAAGALGGLVFARWASQIVALQLSTAANPVSLDLSMDWRVIAFAVAVVFVTAGVSGVAPALRVTRVNPMDILKGHRQTIGGGAGRSLDWAIVAQVALSLVLVVGAGLFVRTFDRLARVSLGFDRDEVVVATITPSTIPTTERNRFYHQLVRVATAVPGVARAGGSLNPPLIGTLGGVFVTSVPGEAPPPGAERISQYIEITPGWFDAYGTRIHAGRDFDDRDTASAEPVMIVNEAFVRLVLRGREAIGTVLDVTSRHPPLGDILIGRKRIVGIVGDAVYRTVRDVGRPTIYFPLAQRPGPLLYSSFYITARSTAGSSRLLTRQMATALGKFDPNMTIQFTPVDEQVRDSLAQDRVIAMLSGFFGALALLLAGLGVYGVTSHAVTRQRSEMGLRLALGAAPASLVRRVMFQLAVLLFIGVVIGGLVSLWASTVVAPLLFGLEPHDPVTFMAAVVALAAIGAVAGWFPAWRAARLDPGVVLREG